MLSVEMVRRVYMVPDPAIPGHEVVGHYSWEWVIVNEKEVVKTGFASRSDAEVYMRNVEAAKANPIPVLTGWQPFKHGAWRRVGDEIECISNRKTLPWGIFPKENAQISELFGDWKYEIRVKVAGWETKIRQA
jgi:hypothetical protein